jgi:hypothetical protein
MAAKLGEDWDYTLRDVKMIEDQIIAVLAGPEAEQHFTGNANPEGARHDYEIAAELALHLEGPTVVDAYLEYLRVKARAIIDARWRLVEALAAQLLTRKTLSGPAIRRCLREALLAR